MINALVGRKLPAQFEESLSKSDQEATMQLSEILNNSASKPLNAQLVVLNTVGQGSAMPAKLATGSSYNVTLTQDDPAFPEAVSQRELSWATLCLLNKLATQFEKLAKEWPTKENPLYVCVDKECVQEIVWTATEARQKGPPAKNVCDPTEIGKELEALRQMFNSRCEQLEERLKKCEDMSQSKKTGST